MSERKFLSVHIEKTAGTSVQDVLEIACTKEQVLVYNPITDRLVRSSDITVSRTNPLHDRIRRSLGNTPLVSLANRAIFSLSARRTAPNQIEVPDVATTDFSAIHGHFNADRFDDYVEDPLMGVMFREPLERMESQYDHWKRTRGLIIWRTMIPYDPSMTFQDYAMLAELQNYQASALGGKDLDEFHFVGVSEHTEAFTDAVLTGLEHEGIIKLDKRPTTKKLNQSPRRRVSSRTHEPGFLRQFAAFHAEDYDLYERAKRRIK